MINTVFLLWQLEICLFFVSYYNIAFATILMKLMMKISKICSLILISGNILLIFYELIFILLLSYRILV